MWALIVMTCIELECSNIQVLNVYATEAACVDAMQKVEVEHGAYGCIRKDVEETVT